MKKKNIQKEEGGQSLVLVALAMIGLMAFAGLALDGGLAYATRRIAQNAADSGSIAGTYELHRQKWQKGFLANQFDENLILSEINKVIESHDVPDTDDIPGNEINNNVQAFYVAKGFGNNSCVQDTQTNYEQLCAVKPNRSANDPDCNLNNIIDRAVGISVEVDIPFHPMFAAFIGINEIEVSNRANDFDQRTAAIVNAVDHGFNGDLWAIYTFDSGSTDGPSTFIEVDPVFQPPTGFAYANVHSQGTFSVGDHPPIMGQVTYCTTGGCQNCNNASELSKQRSRNIKLPDFDQLATLAIETATTNGQALSGDITWGGSPDDILSCFIPDGIWFIDGNLTIPVDRLAVGQSLFIYVNGDVTIDGFFSGVNLSIIAEGTISINGTLRNTYPYPTNISAPEGFKKNKAVLWSNSTSDEAIHITGDNSNSGGVYFADNTYYTLGSIMAPNGGIIIESGEIGTTVRGAVIGNVVSVNSDPQTGAQVRIQYNGFYIPVDPDRIELLK